MSISYTYEIIRVDQQARVMEVVYTAPGRQTMHVGARLPYVGETIEAVVEMYAPVRHWEQAEAEVLTPEIGTTGEITAPVATQPVVDAATAARSQRNMLLAQSDWTQLPDSRLSSEEAELWAEYRQALRDVPQQEGFPDSVLWPVSPDAEPR